MTENQTRIYYLQGSVQNYDWGKKGNDSLVARLSKKNKLSEDESNKPFAELWFGDHPSCPSHILIDGKKEPLSDHINKNPSEILGQNVYSTFGKNLPFLFKVLSIQKPLSIQAHPDKELAKKLNKANPKEYKDDNHKPEMAIPLTPMKALLGFRSFDEISNYIKTISVLREVIGPKASIVESPEEDITKNLKELLHSLMTANAETVKEKLLKHLDDIKNTSSELNNLINWVSQEFPGDVGVFCLYFLNVLNLTPGEAIFLGPNEPHAYLQGDCMECMARSDNVVRAGLTSKFKDVKNLTEMLTYKTGSPSIMHGDTKGKITEYIPPVQEFKVSSIKLDANSSIELNSEGPSIFVIIEGNATFSDSIADLKAEFGDSIFAWANTKVKLTTADNQLFAYCATTNL